MLLPLLNHLYLQIVKVYMFYKIILTESCFVMALEIIDGRFKPYGNRQIKFIARVLKGGKDFLRAGAFILIRDNGIAKHMIILENFTPHSEHILLYLTLRLAPPLNVVYTIFKIKSTELWT